MNRYKRKIDIKTYAKANGLWYVQIFKSLFNLSCVLRYDSFQLIPCGKDDPYHLFYVHKGMVWGADTETQNISHIIMEGQVFGQYEGHALASFNKMTWMSIDKVTLTGINMEELKDYYQTLGVNFEDLLAHLAHIDLQRSHHHRMLSTFSLAGKLDYLEKHDPKLLVKLNWKNLAAYLQVRPETLSREIKRRS